MFKKVKFFWQRGQEFNSAIVKELKPINLGGTEMLYQAGDPANEIYFIHSGKVKLIVDLNDHVKDENLLRHITNYEKR